MAFATHYTSISSHISDWNRIFKHKKNVEWELILSVSTWLDCEKWSLCTRIEPDLHGCLLKQFLNCYLVFGYPIQSKNQATRKVNSEMKWWWKIIFFGMTIFFFFDPSECHNLIFFTGVWTFNHLVHLNLYPFLQSTASLHSDLLF